MTTLKILSFQYSSPTLYPGLNISFLSLTSQTNSSHLIALRKLLLNCRQSMQNPKQKFEIFLHEAGDEKT